MGGYEPYPEVASDATPPHWQIKRLRFGIKMNPSKQELDLKPDELVSFVPMDAVGELGGIRTDMDKELCDIGSGYTYFRDDDVVVAKITPCFENRKGALARGLTNATAFGTTELHVLRADANQLSPAFLFYLTICDRFRKLGESEMYGAGGQKRVPETFIKDFRVGLPSVNEQQAITRFLDHKTKQIDALIVKKQALLDKLAEERAALISHTVTKGLDPTAETRKSMVPWLGDIPAHWQIMPLKYLCEVGNGSTPSRDNIDYWTDDGYPWLNSSVVNQECVNMADQFVTQLALKECHLPIVVPPAVLVGITGEGKTRGMATTLMMEATINQHLAYAKPNDVRLDVRYLRRVFDRAYAYLRNESDGGGSTKGAITCDQIANLKIPLPPVEEQKDIAEAIDNTLGRINQLGGKVERAIERLLEYRSSLITHAITGQIDVRHVPIPEPAHA